MIQVGPVSMFSNRPNILRGYVRVHLLVSVNVCVCACVCMCVRVCVCVFKPVSLLVVSHI